MHTAPTDRSPDVVRFVHGCVSVVVCGGLALLGAGIISGQQEETARKKELQHNPNAMLTTHCYRADRVRAVWKTPDERGAWRVILNRNHTASVCEDDSGDPSIHGRKQAPIASCSAALPSGKVYSFSSQGIGYKLDITDSSNAVVCASL
jgi:hypothetical protein